MADQNQANRAAAESGFDSDTPPDSGEVVQEVVGFLGQLFEAFNRDQASTTPTTAPSSPGVVSGPMRVALAPAPYLSASPIPRPTAPQTYGWDRMTVGIGVALGLLLLGGALVLRR